MRRHLAHDALREQKAPPPSVSSVRSSLTPRFSSRFTRTHRRWAAESGRRAYRTPALQLIDSSHEGFPRLTQLAGGHDGGRARRRAAGVSHLPPVTAGSLGAISPRPVRVAGLGANGRRSDPWPVLDHRGQGHPGNESSGMDLT